MLLRDANTMLRSRRGFREWKRRAINPILKEPGDADVAKSRPLTLITVYGRLFWATMAARGSTVSAEHRPLQRHQNAVSERALVPWNRSSLRRSQPTSAATFGGR